jgi:hypothetical protein
MSTSWSFFCCVNAVHTYGSLSSLPAFTNANLSYFESFLLMWASIRKCMHVKCVPTWMSMKVCLEWWKMSGLAAHRYMGQINLFQTEQIRRRNCWRLKLLQCRFMCLCLQEVASSLGESKRGCRRWLHWVHGTHRWKVNGTAARWPKEIAVREAEDTQVRCSEEILEQLFASTNSKEDGDAAESCGTRRRDIKGLWIG